MKPVLLLSLFGLLSSFGPRKVYPVKVNASYETTPIPLGEDTSDDTAIWLHPTEPEKSIVFGVSKNKEKDGGRGGLGLYDLKGKQIKFYESVDGKKIGPLNNIDIRYNFSLGTQKLDILAASNRNKLKGLYTGTSLFKINQNTPGVELLGHFPIVSSKGENLEPYGLCMGKEGNNYYVFSLLENGELYKHQLKVKENNRVVLESVGVLDVKSFINKKQDSISIDLVMKDVLLEYQNNEFEMSELNEEIHDALAERHQMEGCVGDDFHKELYFGIEKVGVFKVGYDLENPVAVAEIVKSQYDKTKFMKEQPRLTDDIEGISLYHGPNGSGYIVVSVQGISEYAIFNRGQINSYLGSFKVGYVAKDSVTQTDGFDILSTPLGNDYPRGLMAIHDHHNTDEQGSILNGNYKFLSFSKVLKSLGLVDFKVPYNPRK